MRLEIQEIMWSYLYNHNTCDFSCRINDIGIVLEDSDLYNIALQALFPSAQFRNKIWKEIYK